MHSSTAVSAPPSLSTPLAFGQARKFVSPRDVRIRPSPFLSTHVLYSNGAFRYSPVAFGVPSAFERVPPTIKPIRVADPAARLAPSIINALPSSRFVTHTLPSLSTVVREGLRARPFGDVRYSPRIWPVSTSIRTAVPRPELAM